MTFSVHLKNSGSLSLECFMNGLIYNIHDSLWEFPHTNSQKQFTEKMKRFSKKKKIQCNQSKPVSWKSNRTFV